MNQPDDWTPPPLTDEQRDMIHARSKLTGDLFAEFVQLRGIDADPDTWTPADNAAYDEFLAPRLAEFYASRQPTPPTEETHP